LVKHIDKIESLVLVFVFFSFWVGIAPVTAGEDFHLYPEVLAKAELEYGKDARALLIAWEEL
jgi:hypothetical protein